MLKALIVAASISATAIYGLAHTDPIGAVLSNPTHWDGRHVKVSGTVSGLKERTAVDGRTYDVFSLCDGGCVRVFMDGRPHITEGRNLTVEGIFSAAKRIGDIEFQNDIQADSD